MSERIDFKMYDILITFLFLEYQNKEIPVDLRLY